MSDPLAAYKQAARTPLTPSERLELWLHRAFQQPDMAHLVWQQHLLNEGMPLAHILQLEEQP